MVLQANFKRPESVLVLVYTDSAQVLLLQRVSPDNYWQSVTGSLDWHETARQAAARELHEETGLRSSDGEFIDRKQSNRFLIRPPWRSRYNPDVLYNTEYVFSLRLAKIQPVQINQKEHKAYRWLSINQAIALASSNTNRQAIRDYVTV